MKRTLRRAFNKAVGLFEGSGPKVAFIHVPKCGGTSVTNAIKAKVSRFQKRSLNWEAARRAGFLTGETTVSRTGLKDNMPQLQFLLCYHLNCRLRFVSGHYPVTSTILEAYSSDYHFITILRDPVERWKSNYAWNKRLPDPDSVVLPSPAFEGRLEDEFQAVIDSGMARLMGSLIASVLSGRYPRDASEALELGARAKDNLGHFAAVGTLDRLDLFLGEVSSLIGKSVSVRKDNPTRERFEGKDAELYQAVKSFLDREDVSAVIRDHCEPDRLVYEHAVKLRDS